MILPAQYFRAGAGAVIVNSEGLALALERADIPGAWQMPQGGLEAGEEPLHAVLREVAEETGIIESELELLDACTEPLTYELPASARSDKTGRGQAQYWFLFKFKGTAGSIRLQNGIEFSSWKWIPFDVLLTTVADFRKPVYCRIADRFWVHLFKQK